MDIFPYLKSVVDQDDAAVVLCDLDHRILYMNPAAITRYHKRGGADLVGKNLLDCHNPESVACILRVLDRFRADNTHDKVFAYHNDKENRDVYIVALRDADGCLIGYYEKHEYRTPETALPYDLR